MTEYQFKPITLSTRLLKLLEGLVVRSLTLVLTVALVWYLMSFWYDDVAAWSDIMMLLPIGIFLCFLTTLFKDRKIIFGNKYRAAMRLAVEEIHRDNLEIISAWKKDPRAEASALKLKNAFFLKALDEFERTQIREVFSPKVEGQPDAN